MAKRKVRFKKDFNIGRIVSKVTATIVALYAGGTIVSALGEVMNGTSSAFYEGLELIGWTVGDSLTNGTAGNYYSECISGTILVQATAPSATCITSVTGTGILAVFGIIGVASIVLEFVELRMG